MNGWSRTPEPGWGARPGWMARGGAAEAPATLLTRMLDEIDYGMLVVDSTGSLRYANQLGLREITSGGHLQLADGRVSAANAQEHSQLMAALFDGQRGRRRLFSLGRNGSSVSVAVVPLPADDGSDSLVLLVFGKCRASETLSIDFFAHSHGLTAAEQVVLKGLCAGLRPKELARQLGVAISTVRSHICNIRTKTQATSIRDLVNRIAVLPPITPVVKAMPSATTH
ncbi:helix-turn-helix transcriptional regulator [Piscinibacter sp. XHJ-5]|uniref:helix-turn-helix transcriptional regulator n=1 Tax=Piscinibacter sp. XHJ-5 TaxID=3037797 RepID=UPI002452D055|nr:helix-turn-helix transcriptional regulator [Piscinibacter sp. XHJ-5]